MKKILLSFGAMVATFSPLTTIISCGSTNSPLYSDKDYFMSDSVLNDLITFKGYIKVNYDKDEEHNNQVKYTDQEISDKLKELHESFPREYDSKIYDIYFKNINGDNPSYLMLNRKTNRPILYEKDSLSGWKSWDNNFSDIKIQDLSIFQINNLIHLEDSIKGFGSFSSGSVLFDSKERFEGIYSFEIFKTFFDDIMAASNEFEYKDANSAGKEEYNNLNNNLGKNELIFKYNNHYKKAIWLVDKYQFDTSIYNDIKTKEMVYHINEKIANEYGNRNEFHKKISDFFYKKIYSDNIIKKLVSKYNFKNRSKNKTDFEEKFSEMKNGNFKNSDYKYLVNGEIKEPFNNDVYYTTINYKGIKNLVFLYVSKDGTNDFEIDGTLLNDQEAKMEGLRNILNKGLDDEPLSCIKELKELMEDHSNNNIYLDVIYSILNIKKNIDETSLTYVEKAKYEKIKNNLYFNENVVESIENGNYVFTKVRLFDEDQKDELKFDLSIYDSSELEQRVRANSFNKILKDSFENKMIFFNKIDEIFKK